MSDQLISEVRTHFEASKSRRYRERIVALFSALIHFLQDNALTTRQLLQAGESPGIETTIMKSDLTEEGYAVILDSYDRWLRAHNKVDKPITTKMLEKSFAKIRDQKT